MIQCVLLLSIESNLTLLRLCVMVLIRYTRKRYIHSNFIADIWGLDGTKQGTSKIYAKYFLQ